MMETLRCGYPMAGLSAPISPSTTPSDSDGSFAPHLYASQAFTPSPYETDSTATKFEDVSNNNHPNGAYFSDSLSLSSSSDSSSSSSSSSDDLNRRRHRTSSLLSGLSSLSIAESDETCYSFSEDASAMSESPDCSNLLTPPLASAPLEESPLASKERLTKGKKTCRSRSKSCSVQPETTEPKTDNSRKDSFVYDVRLPDEQFLFFVPDLDLVKSHLMFAVREEVDVLKERIVELMDRIKHLECENTMLRQYASPEVLQQIQSQMPMQLQQQPPQSHHSSS